MKTPKSAGTPTIFDKLTDPKQYTGAQKERFDESGKPKGAHKEEVDTGGYTASFVEKKDRKIGAKEQAIIDRLTSPKNFTGAHKERCDLTDTKVRRKWQGQGQAGSGGVHS